MNRETEFVVRDHFHVGNKEGGISWLQSGFEEYFGDLVEPALPPVRNFVHFEPVIQKNQKSVMVKDVFNNRIACFREVFDFLVAQPFNINRMKEGIMFSRGKCNLFLVKDRDGNLRVLDIGFNTRGWGIFCQRPLVSRIQYPRMFRIFEPISD